MHTYLDLTGQEGRSGREILKLRSCSGQVKVVNKWLCYKFAAREHSEGQNIIFVKCLFFKCLNKDTMSLG